MDKQYAIECQDCGVVIRELSPAENQMVARNPYDFIWYCARCKKDRGKTDLSRLL